MLIKKKTLEFLIKRENKLQLIEQMFTSKIVDLSKLTSIVLGDDKREEKGKVKNIDNETIEQVRNNEAKHIKEIKDLEQQIKKYKEVINKLKRYIEGCLELSPIEDRNVTDDVLDKDLKYLLKIMKDVS